MYQIILLNPLEVVFRQNEKHLAYGNDHLAQLSNSQF